MQRQHGADPGTDPVGTGRLFGMDGRKPASRKLPHMHGFLEAGRQCPQQRNGTLDQRQPALADLCQPHRRTANPVFPCLVVLLEETMRLKGHQETAGGGLVEPARPGNLAQARVLLQP